MCECGIDKSILMFTAWHHRACRVMINDDHEGWIFLSHSQIMDYFLAHHFLHPHPFFMLMLLLDCGISRHL